LTSTFTFKLYKRDANRVPYTNLLVQNSVIIRKKRQNMESNFSALDWIIFSSYFLVLVLTSVILSQSNIKTSRDYFTGGNAMPMFAVAISVLATSQSAATFLGGPEYSFGKDLTFLGFYLSALLAVIFVAKVLVPRFYAINAITVYEYLEYRYNAAARAIMAFYTMAIYVAVTIAAVLSVVCDHQESETSKRLRSSLVAQRELVAGSLSIPIDQHRDILAIGLTGCAGDVQNLANEIQAMRGVTHGRLSAVPLEDQE